MCTGHGESALPAVSAQRSLSLHERRVHDASSSDDCWRRNMRPDHAHLFKNDLRRPLRSTTATGPPRSPHHTFRWRVISLQASRRDLCLQHRSSTISWRAMTTLSSTLHPDNICTAAQASRHEPGSSPATTPPPTSPHQHDRHRGPGLFCSLTARTLQTVLRALVIESQVYNFAAFLRQIFGPVAPTLRLCYSQ